MDAHDTEILKKIAQIVWDVKWESMHWLAGREPACDVILERITEEFDVDVLSMINKDKKYL